jgi:hypothetical protein
VTPGSDFFKNPSSSISRRGSAAWKPFGSEKLSVKAGAGVHRPLTTS